MNEDPKAPPRPGDTLIGGAVIAAVLGCLAFFADGFGEPGFAFSLAAILAMVGAVRRIRYAARRSE